MRKTLFLLCLSLAINANAQITVNASNFFDVGNTRIMADSYFLTTNDSPGANKIWDYSRLDTNKWVEKTTFVMPFVTPHYNRFQTSNIAIYDPLYHDAMYYKKDFYSLKVMGYYTGEIMAYSNPLVEYEFPIAFGNTLQDYFDGYYTASGASHGYNSDSVRVRFYGTHHYKVDSWGSLILPNGTFNALRLKDTLIFNITEEELNSGTWTLAYEQYDTLYSNVFVTNDPGTRNELLKQYLYDNGSVEDNSWSYTRRNYLAIDEKLKSNIFSLFPNPVINEISIESKVNFDSYYITDLMGKIVINKTIYQENKINVSSLAKGKYILTMVTKNNHSSLSFVKN